jgi:hypothetical protein
MNEENLELLNDNAVDIAEAFMGGGGHESNTDVVTEYLKEEFEIEFEDSTEAEDFTLACQSGIEQAIYEWTKKKRDAR